MAVVPIRHVGQRLGSRGKRQFFRLLCHVEIATIPAFLRQVGKAVHFDPLAVVRVPLDFKVAILRAKLGPRLQVDAYGPSFRPSVILPSMYK